MEGSCFFECGNPCQDQFDFHCRQCQTRYHFACLGPHVETEYRCKNCKTLFSDTTVAFWAVGTYEDMTVEQRIQCAGILDVNYLHEGKIVAYLPYRQKGPNKWKMGIPRVSANWGPSVHCPGGKAAGGNGHWAKENWWQCTQALWSVKL